MSDSKLPAIAVARGPLVALRLTTEDTESTVWEMGLTPGSIVAIAVGREGFLASLEMTFD